MTVAMLRMRENLFNARVLQASTTDVGAREGTVLFFDQAQQLYGVLWQEATESQDLLEFVSLEVLSVLLVDMGMRGIVHTMIQFKGNGASRTSTTNTSDTKAPQDNGPSPAYSAGTNSKKRQKSNPTPTPAKKRSQKRKVVENTPTAKKSKTTPKTETPKVTAKKPVSRVPLIAPATNKSKSTGNGKSPRSLARYAKARTSNMVESTPRHASSILNPSTSPQPTSTEQYDNHTLQHSLVPGAVRVMPRYSLPYDPYPLAAYNGLSPGGLFEFHVGPNQSAFLTRADVSVSCWSLELSRVYDCLLTCACGLCQIEQEAHRT